MTILDLAFDHHGDCVEGNPWRGLWKSLRALLVDCNSNYIGLRICIIKNTRCCNEILITIHLFGDNTIIEPWRQ